MVIMHRPYDTASGEMDGGRPCARGEHCAARTTKPESGDRVVVPAATYRTFCEADRGMIRDCLNELPGRYRQLGKRFGDRGGPNGPRVSGGGYAPGQPYNLGIDALQRQIAEIILSWDERVRTPTRLSDLSAAGIADAVDIACGVLVAHVDVLLGLERDGMYRSEDISRVEQIPEDAIAYVHLDAGWIWYAANYGGREAGIEVLNLHHRSISRLGLTPQHQNLITRCWQCGERKLRRHDGTAGLADHVECLRCREQYLGSRLASLMVEEDAAQQRRRAREHRGVADSGGLLYSGGAGYGGRP
jgi:hypothetical protein